MPLAIQFLIPILGGLLAGLGSLGCILWLAPRGREARACAPQDILSEPRTFRFRNGYLVDHSDNVAFLLSTPVNHLRAWDELIEALTEINVAIPAAFEGLRDLGRAFKLTGQFGRDRILVLGQRDGADLRVTVASAEARQTSLRIDLRSLEAMEAETAMLARSGDTSPALAWAADAEGRVVWSNAAYLDLAARCEGADAAHGWPLHVLFPIPDGKAAPRSRRKVRDREGEEHWFEVTVNPPAADGLRHVHALSLEAVIQAEESLRTFIQTLTRSFAHLPTGLAIFDRKGQLALFNPALLDMTGLDAAWLSRRPLLVDLFDALRDRQKLPEPRDYRTWRDRMAGIGGGEEIYRESWSLPSGLTYRVTARPQGDGAVTLLLEDVTADIAAMRAHHEEREAMCRLLDGADGGIVVFDADGERIVTNAAASALWRADGGELPKTLDGCIAYWKTLTRPSPVWGDLRDMLRGPEPERAGWTEALPRDGFEALAVTVAPLPGGRTALTFLDASPQSSVAAGGPATALRA